MTSTPFLNNHTASSSSLPMRTDIELEEVSLAECQEQEDKDQEEAAAGSKPLTWARACFYCLSGENESFGEDGITQDVDTAPWSGVRQTWVRYNSSSVSRIPLLPWEVWTPVCAPSASDALLRAPQVKRLKRQNLPPLSARYLCWRRTVAVVALPFFLIVTLMTAFAAQHCHARTCRGLFTDSDSPSPPSKPAMDSDYPDWAQDQPDSTKEDSPGVSRRSLHEASGLAAHWRQLQEIASRRARAQAQARRKRLEHMLPKHAARVGVVQSAARRQLLDDGEDADYSNLETGRAFRYLNALQQARECGFFHSIFIPTLLRPLYGF